MEVQGNGSIVHSQRHNNNNNNVRYCYGDVRNNLVAENGCVTTAIADNSKKKTKKWSLSGLFKKRRTKSSDTDSSSEAEYKKGGLLSRNSHRRKGGSRKVVGKFEAIILPKDDSSTLTTRNGGVNLVDGAGAGGGVCRSNGIELYDASPNVIKRKRNKVRVANGGDGVSRSNQEICAATFGETGRDFDRPEMIKGISGGSLDAASRRNEKSKVKARVEAMRDRLRDESSSSSDECASSCRNSNGSLPKSQQAEYTRTAPPPPVPVPGSGAAGTGSWSRKSRAARTDRYAKRHHQVSNGEAIGCSPPFSNPDLTARPNYTPVGSPRSRWIAKVVYQQSNDYPMRYTARTHSATSSPMSSPLSKPKNFQSRSLPSKHCAPAVRSPPPSPPPPPPRNPNRKAVPSAAAADKYAIRPSSYAFDANARQKEISSYILSNEGNNGDDTRLGDDNLARFKSQSEMELRSRRYNAFPPSVAVSSEHTYPKNRNRYSTGAGVAKAERKKLTNSANTVPQTPPLQSNVYINRNLYADEKPCPNYSPRAEFTPDFRFNDSNGPSLRKANEIGIPIVDASAPLVGSRRSKSNDRRPLSAVSEKSDNDVLAENVNVAKTKTKAKPKPRNLEEALVELEEIYNSLKLSDDDLLDRADRRDLQAAVKLHSNSFGRHWSDDDDDSDDSNDEDVVDAAKNGSLRANRPRLPTSRRSAVPDAVTDDMAYRKLRRKVSGDVKSNPNLVSQSGSFLLMSPTFSPPPLVDVPPHSSSAMLFGGKEPDITLDDVVFRNIRHTNNTLKVSEPQPPFGIPLSPASPAPYSDYLHAVPSDKYRSTFNPSRTPDVVKDDLAFRNLRKDVRTEGREPVAVASKQRRAIRSLSANVVSLLGQRGKRSGDDYDYDEPVDSVCSPVNDSAMPATTTVTSNDRCASFNDLPCSSQDWRRVRQPPRDDVDETLDLVANETRALGKALEMKLRQLDAGTTPSAPSSNGLGKDVFAKRVVVHKPITLSRFEIAERDDDQSSHWRPSQLKLVENTDTTESPTTNDTATDRGNSLVNSCPDFNWNDVRITNVQQQQQPKRAEFGLMETSTVATATATAASATSSDLKSDKTENSSSGVSSTSNTPDSARKCHISASGDHKHDNSPATKVWYLDENVLPSFEHASRQFSQELRNVFECTDTDDDVVGNCKTNVTTPATTDVSPSSTHDAVARSTTVAPSNKKDFCSRIEITLATPQPAGTLPNGIRQKFHQFTLNDLLIHLIYIAACLCEFFFATYSVYEFLLVLVSSLAYFTLTERRT